MTEVLALTFKRIVVTAYISATAAATFGVGFYFALKIEQNALKKGFNTGYAVGYGYGHWDAKSECTVH